MNMGPSVVHAGGVREAQQDKSRVTHVEIRRVQNGFVVMAIDYMDQRFGPTEIAQRASFVAGDPEQLKTIIENILNAADMQWLPTADLPILDLRHHLRREVRQDEERRGKEAARAEMVRQALLRNNPPAGALGQQLIGPNDYNEFVNIALTNRT